MSEQEITELKYRLLKSNKFSDEQIDVVEYEISKILSKRDRALVEVNGNGNLELTKHFLVTKKVNNLSDRTLEAYKGTIERFHIFLAGKNFLKVTEHDVRMFLGDLQFNHQASAVTLNNVRRNLSSFYSFLRDYEYMNRSPFSKIPKIKEPKRQKEALEMREIELIRNSVFELFTNKIKALRFRAIFELLLSTGIRAGGLVNIKETDVNFVKRSIKVLEKGNKERIVFFNEITDIVLKNYLKEKGTKAGNEGYLFTNEYNERKMGIGKVEEILRFVGRELDIRLHPHKLRRTFATTAIKKGMSMRNLQKLMGHTNIATTQIYLDTSTEEIEEAYRKIF